MNLNTNTNTESPSKIIEKHNKENTPPGFFSKVEEYPLSYTWNPDPPLRHVWAERYDRDLEDTFGVQGNTFFPVLSHKVLVNSYTQRPVGVVGSGYKVQQMEEYTQAAENLLMDILPPAHFKGLQITDSMSHHSAIRARKYTFPSVGMPIETKKHKTETGLTLVMLQSYDGSGSNGFLTGLIDYHCLNGMVSGDFSRGNKRHTSGFNLGEFILQIERMTQEYYKSIRRYQAWASKEIPLFAGESVIDSLPGMSKRRGKKLKEQFLLEVSTRGSNMWALASALTYYASHNSPSFPVKGSAANDNETKALLVRGRQVSRWLESKQFQSLAQAA